MKRKIKLQEKQNYVLCLYLHHAIKLQPVNIAFAVCSQGFYAENCTTPCACNMTNTADCNVITGVCSCKSGWNGTTCNIDIDECADGTNTCNTTAYQGCRNTDGSYQCYCLYGNDTNTIDCLRKYFLVFEYNYHAYYSISVEVPSIFHHLYYFMSFEIPSLK